ncbi:MAG TPA: hypothetical protein VK607_27130, partial [Kofleriaceae bacterium]|nr:hypothetical protein [Kofleriaceae bacterium]
AKSGLQQAFDRDLSNDAVVLGLVHDGLYLDRKLEFWARHNAAVAALTVEQVNAAVKRHVKPGTLVKITAGDKKKM